MFWYMDGLIRAMVERRQNFRSRIAIAILKREINKMDETKVWWKSKTLWVNTLTGVAGVLMALSADKGIDPKTVGYAATALGGINVVLRLLTDKPISGSQQ